MQTSHLREGGEDFRKINQKKLVINVPYIENNLWVAFRAVVTGGSLLFA